MIVYVVVANNGYEGYSKPRAVFTDKRLAEAMQAGAEPWNRMEILEYNLDEIRNEV